MKKESVALFALVIIVLASLSVFVVGTNTNVFSDIFPSEAPTVAVGDCVNVTYIGHFASNNTVFDSSYGDWQNKTNNTPLHVYVSYNKTATAPKSGYSSDMIKGFMDGLIGMKEGQTKTVTIAPKDAYGANKLQVGDRFVTTKMTYSNYNRTLNQTVVVTNMSGGNLTLHWVNVSFPQNFTMLEGVIMENLTNALQVYMSPYQMVPYYMFENCSHVTNITNTSVVITTTPKTHTNISKNVTYYYSDNKIFFVFPDATNVTWNDSKINMTSNPVKGAHYAMDLQGTHINLTVGNVSKNNINLTAEVQGGNQSLVLNRTISFNRTYIMPRIYKIPFEFQGYPLAEYFIGDDVTKAGYSLNHLAGETLTFQLTVDKIYKTSLTNSTTTP